MAKQKQAKKILTQETISSLSCKPNWNSECHYASMFDKWKKQISLGKLSIDIPVSDNLLYLPHDSEGKCLFHSENVKWKEKNNFLQRLKLLIRLLNTDPDIDYISLDNVVFIGDTSTGTPKTITEYNKDGTLKKKYTRKNRNIDLRKQVFSKAISALDAIFLDHVDFSGSNFKDRVTFSNITFEFGVTFYNAAFKESVFFDNSTFEYIADFKKTEFGFCNEFEPSTSFCKVTFNCEPSFNDAIFNGSCSFRDAQFKPYRPQPGDTEFQGTIFKKNVDFRNTVFNCGADFQDAVFEEDCDFIDTRFYNKRYLLFNDIQVYGNLVFKGNSKNKLFKHTVLMDINPGKISGKISFEDANLSYMVSEHLHHLEKLSREKERKVLIGPGCLKYRHTTSPKVIHLDKRHHNLVMEITSTFTNYFEVYNGFNIGVEIVEKSDTMIRLIYFSDENIDEETWYKRMQKTETAIWDLLYRSPSQQSDSGKSIGWENSITNISAPANLFNVLDVNINLLGIFLKIGIRIKGGMFKNKKNVEALFDCINFTGIPRFKADDLPMIIQNNFIDLQQKITGSGNTQEINIYKQLEKTTPSSSPQGKKRILLLSANPARNSTRLRLDEEMREIEESLKRSKRREKFEIKTVLAVRFLDLRRALLEYEPQIVHFAGHGTQKGLMVMDEIGFPTTISSEALSQLFQLFSNQVECVILSACYSVEQATAISKHIPYVVCMQKNILDKAAIEFAIGFYDTLGVGRSFEEAFQLGRQAILQKFPDQAIHLVPLLEKK